MKKCLILVLSADFAPYNSLMQCSINTWDSVEVEGCETVFYCGESDKPNTDKIIYLPVRESLHSMGEKMLMAFEWALRNKEFDYIARPHSCIYVDKKELIKYVQDLPSENVFAGLVVDAVPKWMWGGCGLFFSKDVAQKLVNNRKCLQLDKMEDMGLSYLATMLGIPFTDGRGCSINKTDKGWLCMCYGTESYEFQNFSEIKKDTGQLFYRVKMDGEREKDLYIMKELFKVLN